MTGVGDLSDDELLLLATGPEDSLAKQRKRGPRRAAPAASPHAGISDEELLAAIGDVPRETSGGAPPATSSYSGPTDYRAEAGLPPVEDRSHLGPSTDESIADTEASRGVLDKLGIDLHPDQRAAWDEPADPANPTPQERERLNNPHDPITEAIVTGLPAHGVGKAVGAVGRAIAPNAGPVVSRIGRAIQGATEGGTATYLGGGSGRDVAMGAALGGAVGAMNRPARAAHEPRTQAEIDASVIKTYRMQHPDPVIDQAMQGTHETHRLAREANDLLSARVGDRVAANGKLLDTADADFSMLDGEYPIPDTSNAIERIQGIRERSYGGQGPMLSSDPTLADTQRQLTIGKAQNQMVPRDVLRTVQRNLNEEADFQGARSSQAKAALQNAAGVVSETARGADPRLGPGNLGGALDKYGFDKDALSNIDELRGPEAGRVPKLARVGGGDQMADPSIHQAEAQVRDLQAAEPAANSLIDRIRYNNTVGRRSMKLPYISYSPTATAARGIKQNFDNLRFKLAPPAIDEAGQVAAQGERYSNPLILPLELELLERQRQQENRR